MGRDYKKPGDKPGMGTPGKLFEKAKKQVERASRMLEKQGVQAQTPDAEGAAGQAEKPQPEKNPSQEWKEHLPPAHGIAQDTIVTDKMGHALTLRTEDGSTEQLEQALRADQGHVAHSMRIRVLDGKREAGRANLTLEVDKRFNTATRHYDRVAECRMRLNDIEVSQQDRKRGVGSLMLERTEDLAQQGGAREIYGTLGSEHARPFFEKHGYQVRRGQLGGQQIHKTIYHS